MISEETQVTTAVSLATATALAVEVVMRLPRNKISGAQDGNILTRTSAAALCMTKIITQLEQGQAA